MHSSNHVLAALGGRDFALLEPHLEPVELPVRRVLQEADEAVEHIYFPETGVASIIASSGEDKVEVGLFGWESMSGISVVNGNDTSPMKTFVQIAGVGVRLPVERFTDAVTESRSLHSVFLRASEARSIQLAYTALANGRLTIEERLARWILMCHDRTKGDDVPLTHEFLSLMLGVRRAGVTTALHILEGEHVIRATRGMIQIRDRAKLEERAGPCYGIPERHSARLIGLSGTA